MHAERGLGVVRRKGCRGVMGAPIEVRQADGRLAAHPNSITAVHTALRRLPRGAEQDAGVALGTKNWDFLVFVSVSGQLERPMSVSDVLMHNWEHFDNGMRLRTLKQAHHAITAADPENGILAQTAEHRAADCRKCQAKARRLAKEQAHAARL